MQPARRRRAYFALMGTCVLLIVLAWNVVRLWSISAAVAMSVMAALLAPIASIVGNLGALDGSKLPRDKAPREWPRSAHDD